jgi:hypothetical protein
LLRSNVAGGFAVLASPSKIHYFKSLMEHRLIRMKGATTGKGNGKGG